MAELQNAMENLSNQYYNALVKGLNLNPQSFQLYQGTESVGALSEWVWKKFDTIPVKSIISVDGPGQFSSLNKNYQGVIAQLNPAIDNSFQNEMGDYYNSWLEYLNSNEVPKDVLDSADNLSSCFKNWAIRKAPGKMNCVSSLISSFYNDIVTISNVMYSSAQSANKGFAYNVTIDDVKNKLMSSRSANFEMCSKTESKDVSNTWAKASTDINYSIFSFEADAEYKKLSEKLIESEMNISVVFDNVATIEAGPLTDASNDPILRDYKPWYHSGAFSRAYGTNDNIVWKHGSPTWESTFGDNGNIQRICTALVIVDGINIEIESKSNFTETEQKSLKILAKTGIWPFFSISGSGDKESDVNFTESGSAKFSIKCKKGNPQLLGRIVTSIQNILG